MTAKPLTLPRPNSALALLATAILGSILLAVSAKVSAPMWPVPMTLQTLALVLIAAYAGPRGAVLTVLAYLAEGAAGLPVFSAGGGIGYFTGPTAGYLIAFLPAAWLAAMALSRPAWRKPVPAFAVFLAAHAVVFAGGVAWLSVLTGFEAAVSGGLLPFLPGAALKSALAAAIIAAVRPG